MRTLLAASALLVLAGAVAAQDKKFESREGKYAVLFPGTPTTESKSVGDLTLNTTSSDAKGVGYMVIHADLPADTVKASKPGDILKTNEAGLVKSFKANVSKSEAGTFGKEKYPSRTVTGELKVDATTLHVRITLVLVEGRLYEVLAIGGKDGVFGKDADRFFESFEIKK